MVGDGDEGVEVGVVEGRGEGDVGEGFHAEGVVQGGGAVGFVGGGGWGEEGEAGEDGVELVGVGLAGGLVGEDAALWGWGWAYAC